MLLSYFVFLFILPAAISVPFTRPEAAQASQDHWWSHVVESVGRALGMRGYKHGGSYAIDLGMPQTGDNWFWNLNGWTLAESELSVVDQEPIQTFMTRPALFGTHIVNSPGLLGHLLPLNSFTVHRNTTHKVTPDARGVVRYPLSRDNTGCPPLHIPEGHPQPSMNESWIALVMRGGCGFDEKVRQAQSLGARAAVVGASPPADGRDISIPAVYVTHATYAKLIELVRASNMSTSGLRTISVVLGPEETWAWWSPILSFAILLLLPSIMTLVTLFVHRIRAARHAARQRAPGDVVRALPIRVWTGAGWVREKDWIASHPNESSPSGESESNTVEPASGQVVETNDQLVEDGTTDPEQGIIHPETVVEGEPESEGVPNWFASQGECAICLSSFARGDRVRVLPCSHVFHVDEVDGWLLNRRKVCPICKADVTHPAPRTAPRVFPVAVHPADADIRTVAGSGLGVLDDAAESGVGSGSTPGSPLRESGPRRWWQRVWRRERDGSAATERTPLLSD
ncbi:hypothetical protein BDV93DRAFT_539940 [Ceratobasidium sp. AG-I]|nr:hypothetical protein BDV93DRAFT_539940 [Ceratobasidium sp. AG-I]